MVNQAGTVLTVDLGAIAANYRLLQSRVGGTVRVAAAIKADAYGLGAAEAAPALARAGCDAFFVATADEGAALRKLVAGDIYLLNGMHTGDVGDIRAHNLIPILNSLQDIAAWKEGPCAIHFDTGMNRLGLGRDETQRVLDNPSLLDHLDIRQAMSHFACSEDAGNPMNREQCNRLRAIKNALGPRLKSAKWSLCNSSGIFHAPDDLHDMVRPGLALYGGNPTPGAANPMQGVVTLEAAVLQTRRARKGETCGYGATHRFDADTETATLNIGYADGYFRSFSGRGEVYWQGQACPVLGRVSMDLLIVGTGHLKGSKPGVGDRMEVIGPNNPIDAVAARARTLSYEILTALGGRYARVYKSAS